MSDAVEHRLYMRRSITNVLHVVSTSGADDQMTLRIAIAQLLSFIIVVILFIRSKAAVKPTFRADRVRDVFRSSKSRDIPENGEY